MSGLLYILSIIEQGGCCTKGRDPAHCGSLDLKKEVYTKICFRPGYLNQVLTS